MDSSLYKLSAKDVIKNVRSGRIRARDVALSCIARISKFEDKVKAWAFLDKDIFVKQAQIVDEKVKLGLYTGSLAGVPVGVKDIFNTVDMPTCMGSPLWRGFTPGNDARTVFMLRQEDAVIAGKTVTAEFAVHEPGPTRNPHNIKYYPGTSSSGSAVAVATGMVPVALGTQTAGSTIRPASYCGVYGFKPSFGLIPRTGVLKTNDTLDQIGWFARNVEDIEILFNALRVKGPNYPYVHEKIDKKDKAYFARKKWKILFVKHTKWDHADEYAKGDYEAFKDLCSGAKGFVVAEKTLPKEFADAHQIHDIIYNKTLSYYFAEEYKEKHLVSDVLCELVEKGQKITPREYEKALAGQVALRNRLSGLIKKYDVILTLSTSGQAPEFPDPVDKPDSCLIWNLCGMPAMNVPVFKGPDGLPFGMQAVASHYMDPLLFNFVKELRRRKLAKDVLPIDAKG